MKHRTLILLVMALVVGIQRVKADSETVSPYTVDFNTTISTSDHAFRVASGWGHVADAADGAYPQYTYVSSKGVGSSGALRCGTQTLTYWNFSTSSYQSKDVNDLLVTPAVSGAVSIQTERYNYSHSLIFFKLTKNANGTFTVGDTLTVNDGTDDVTEITGLSGSSYTTVSIGNFPEPTYIGIRASGVYLDNFSADSAIIEPSKALSIVTTQLLNSTPDTREDGTFPVTLSLKLSNFGDFDLAPGDENYSFTLIEAGNNTEVGTVPANINLAVGAQAKDTVTFYLNYADHSAKTRYKVRENIMGLEYQYQPWNELIYVTPIPYVPVMGVSVDKKDLADNDTVSFGKILKPSPKYVVVSNSGAKTLTITDVTASGGFSVDKTAFTVAAHASDTITVTAPADEVKDYNGMLVIKADELSDFHLKLMSTALDSTKFFADFENNKIPDGSYVETPNWRVSKWGIDGSWGKLDNKYALENISRSQEDKFVTPLLHAEAGDSIQVDVARNDGGENPFESYVKVYYSKDLRNWTLLDSIGSDRLSSVVEYHASWGYDHYKFNSFTVKNIPEGDCFIGFGSGFAVIDNIYGLTEVPVSHEVLLKDQSFPAAGTVNSEYKATVALTNILSKTELASSYTGKLYIGEDSFDIATKDLTKDAYVRLEFKGAPHKTGTLPAYAVFYFADGYTVKSDTFNVEVSAETASNEVQIGENETTSDAAPLKLNYYNSETETVYDTALLSGLSKGTKITSITYKGYRSSSDMNATLNIWIANTADAPAASASDFTMANTDTMTSVYSGDYTYPSGGSSSDPIDIITVNLPQPFTYTGQNLRVIVRSENANSYKSTYFVSTNDKTHTYGRYKDSHDDFLAASYSAYNTPVIYFGVEKSPASFFGTVVNEQDAPVADASVVLTSGMVQYSDTTSADGSFSMVVMKDRLKYAANVLAAGYEPYTDSVSIDSVARTIKLKTATGLYMKGFTLPATGSVNAEYKASATVMNDLPSAIAKDGYTAELYVDGKVVATAPTEELASMESRKYDFAFTPHAAGTYPATIHFTYDGNTYATDTVNLVIAEEVFGGEYTACDSTYFGESTPSRTPWQNYYKMSNSVIVYTPEEIQLEAGSVITRIRFRGKFTQSNTGKEAVSMFIANSDFMPSTTADAQNIIDDTTSMVRLLDITKDTIEYDKSTEIEDVINLPIPGGLVYTGGNLVVVFNGNHKGYSDNKLSVISDGKVSSTAWYRQADSGTLTTRSFSKDVVMPVMYMTVENKKTVSGKVVRRSGEPVADASLTLKSGDIEYYATSAEDGSYSMTLSNGKLTYSLTAEKDGFKPGVVEGISFSDSADVVVNDTLLSYVKASSTVKGKETNPYKTAETIALAGAKVNVSAGDVALPEITTAEDGTFSVDSLLEGTEYTFVVTAEGYKDSTFTYATPAADDSIADIILNKLVTTISLHGKVMGKETNPYKTAETVALAGAKVTVTIDGKALPEITTADDGTFDVDSLTESGTYTFTVSADGYNDTTFTYTAPAANDTLPDIVLKRVVKTITATGKVLGQDADLSTYTLYDPSPLAGATVTVVDANGETVATVTTAANGTYELSLTEAGVYTITYSCEGYADSVVTFTAGAEDATLDDVILKTAAATGINAISAEGKTLNGDVYTINGQYVGRDVDPKQLSRGIYIVGGKKITVK